LHDAGVDQVKATEDSRDLIVGAQDDGLVHLLVETVERLCERLTLDVLG
jgi:hypothetical protein